MNATAMHLAALGRLYSPTAGELAEHLIEASKHQAELAGRLDPHGHGAEARVDALLTHVHGIQKTALRLREIAGGAHANP